MEYLSNWHDFNAEDRSTYPKVDAAVQVRYDSGSEAEGYGGDFFPLCQRLSGSTIVNCCYIKAKDIVASE
jgi:hypothetical protein